MTVLADIAETTPEQVREARADIERRDEWS